MNENTPILMKLVEEDFGLNIRGRGKYIKSVEHDSLVIDTEKGIFYWNSENIVGDALIYLTKVRKMPFSSAREFLRDFSYSESFIYNVRTEKEDVVVYPKLVEIFYEEGSSKERRDYLYRRGISDETIDKFRIGWYNDYTMIPFFEDGIFMNFQMRMDNPRKIIRSYYKMGSLLYNSDILKIVDTVYITEGPTDAIIMMQNGLPAISTNSSGNILPKWYNKFKNQKLIYLIYDNDVAGIEEAIKSAKVLGELRCKIYCFQNFIEQKGYDPVDFFWDGHTKEDFINLVEEESKYSFQLIGKQK